MNILLVSYGDYDYDGRLRELCKVFSSMGELYVLCRSSSKINNPNYCIYKDNSYLRFVRFAYKYSKFVKKHLNIQIIVCDNRKSVIPGLIIKNKCKIKFVIQDCRELYFVKDAKRIVSKLGCIIEKPSIKKADLVICANSYRADIMKKEYNLSKQPIVFENLRKLEFSTDVDLRALSMEYERVINVDMYRIIATSGCDLHRLTDVLVKNIRFVRHKVLLILVGDSFETDVNSIRSIINDLGLGNVIYLGRVNQNQLKYLIQNCHIGIVNYGQYDYNNKYCASGKLFEFIYEGIPVVTTTNPPLSELCNSFSIGVADDEFFRGIDTILDNYNFFKSQVLRFGLEYTVEKNNCRLIENLKSSLPPFL